ncbi:AtzG-like protein [Lyngbya aestuarii]|uniref:AtzG-like protein n=1 Tax=Lyngbya aestuarii TaxID=118322 RepID=UPI00403DAF7F
MEKTLDLAVYVAQMSQLLDLSLEPENLPGVVDNLRRMSAIASLVMEFPLPEDVEAAPVFEP